MKHDDARGSTQSYELPTGIHLLIDPAYAGEAEKVQAGATKTWCTGGEGGFECLVWAARAEGAQTHGAEDGRMWADMIIGVDTATIVLVDAATLGAISGNDRPQVGEYVSGRALSAAARG